VDAVLKSVLDYGLGVLMLIATLPVMALIALGLKLNRRDKPVLVRHQTLGQSGTTFEMCKFNTRIESVSKLAGSSRAAIPIPPGVSRLERTLYRRGLDKLPQLFNVVKGQMSMVGLVAHRRGQDYARAALNLQTVKPGMIGPWTLPGVCSSGDETQDELYYVRNWTIWMDLHVVFQAILKGFANGWLARPAIVRTSARPAGVPAKSVKHSSVALAPLGHERDRRELP
jgi:lipopolysaccharide/colanic/teichoic acid biosynthesis glycosyltransferase